MKIKGLLFIIGVLFSGCVTVNAPKEGDFKYEKFEACNVYMFHEGEWKEVAKLPKECKEVKKEVEAVLKN